MLPVLQALSHRADQLKAEHEQNEQNAHDFSRATLSEPSFDPGEYGLHQNQVEQGEGQHNEQGPGEENGARETDAEKNSQQANAAQRAGGIEESVGQTDQEE